MKAKEFVAAVKTISWMEHALHPKAVLTFAVDDGTVSRRSGNWVDAALNCSNEASDNEVVETAIEFLFADVLAESENNHGTSTAL
jgi:hypothetical protein